MQFGQNLIGIQTKDSKRTSSRIYSGISFFIEQKLGDRCRNKSGKASHLLSLVFALLSVVLLVFSKPALAQCDVIKDVKDSEQADLTLFFYPSTLRMINIDKNEEFNRLIQDINKMIFMKMNRSWRSKDFYSAIQSLQSEEDMEEYIVIDGPDAKLYILGREKPTETVGLGMMENEYYIFDVDGSLSLKEIPKLYEYISQNDSTFNNAFLNVFDVSSQFNRANRHRKVQKEYDD